jgi:hypothetical protein
MKDWFDKRLEKNRQLVIDHAGIVISQFNEENERKREYNGRQLLEMLQNAEDQITDDGLVVVKLSKDAFTIANMGKPFSKGGVESLMTPNLSEKSLDENNIGAKGLGFRSLLNWSSSIEIISNDLSIEFSKDVAGEFLQKIFNEHPDLSLYFRSKRVEQYPIPILIAPRWKDVDLNRFKRFGAIIRVKFDSSSKVFEDIKSQLMAIDEGELIFLRKITTIKIHIEQEHGLLQRQISKKVIGDQVTISIHDDNVLISEKTWSLMSKTGILPSAIQDQGFKNYELKLAVNDEHEDTIDKLFSFFKTNVHFKFPGLVHGTFQLTGDRNRLVKGEINNFLFKELSQLLVDNSLRLAKQGVNWLPLKLLTFDKETEKEVSDFNFFPTLIGLIKGNNLFPTVHENYINHSNQPVFYSEGFADVIPFKKYGILTNLVKHSQDELLIGLLKRIGNFYFGDLPQRLNPISSSLLLSERANLILFIQNSKIFEKIEVPELLIDESSNVISQSFDVFIAPEENIINIPEGIKITFLSTSLLSQLKTASGTKENQDIIDLLPRFKILKYSLGAVVRRVVAQEKELRKKDNNISILIELLLGLFDYWKKVAEPPMISDIDFELPDRGMVMRSAKLLHFGKNMLNAPGSEINEEILLSDDELFMCDTSILHLQDTEETIRFFKWLGVKSAIEIKQVSLSEAVRQNYIHQVVENLPYPFLTGIGKQQVESAEEFLKLVSRWSIETPMITGLQRAISIVRPEVLICWLATHSELRQMLKESRSIEQRLSFKTNQNSVWGTIPTEYLGSYLAFLFSDIQWLPSSNGKNEKPANCVRNEFRLASGTVPQPVINMSDQVFLKYNVPEEMINEILYAIGVKKDLSHLSQTALYELLLKLPEQDSDHQTLAMIYRSVFTFLVKRELNESDSGYKEFLEKGFVLVIYNDELLYVPVIDAYYVSDNSLSSTILRQLKVFQIGLGLSVDDVKRYFGIRPVSDISFRISGEIQLHQVDQDFNKDLLSFKMAFYAERLTDDLEKAELSILKSLKVSLCSSLTAEFCISGNNWQPLDISELEYVNINNEHGTNHFIYVPYSYETFSDLKDESKLHDSVISIVCNSIGISSDDKYKYLYSRSDKGRKERVELNSGSGLDLYNVSAKCFENDLSDEIELFWRPIIMLKGIEHPELLVKDFVSSTLGLLVDQAEVEQVLDGYIYSPINSSGNLRLLRKFFKLLGITIVEYNSLAKEKLNFQPFLQDEINVEHHLTSEKFIAWRYHDLKTKNYYQNRTYFDDVHLFSKLPEIDFSSGSLDYLDYYGDWLSQTWGISYEELSKETRIININEKLLEQRERFKARVSNDIFSRYDASNYVHKSLLLMDEFEQLESLLEVDKSTLVTKDDAQGTDLEQAIEVYQHLVEIPKANFPDDQIVKQNADQGLATQSSNSERQPYHRPGYATYTSNKTLNEHKAQSGLVGELLVYKYLLKQKVNGLTWLSENAREAGYSNTGDDSLGYDMRYIDQNGSTIYVEVKATKANEPEFTIPSSEYSFALANQSNYLIAVVTNIGAQQKKCFMLRLSDFEDGLSSSDHFVLTPDSFKVKVLNPKAFVEM